MAPRRVAGAAPPFAVALSCFLLSGAGALVVETVWMRWLRLLLGGAAPAASATLVAFFVGQALGAVGAARLAPRLRRPLRAYGLLELAAAAWALLVPVALRLGEGALAGVYDELRASPGLLVAARFGVALAATLPAATAFGATLPVLASAVVPGAAWLGRRGVTLYAVNTGGAALGTAAAAFVLPARLGVTGTYVSGLGGLLAAAGLAVIAARRWPGSAGPPPAPPRPAPASAGPRPLALPALAALSGFASFAAQVVLVQAHGLVLDQSVFAFGCVLITVLAALAAAAGLVAALEARGVPSQRLLALGLWGAAAGFLAVPALFVRATSGLTSLRATAPWPDYALDAIALGLRTAGPALLAAGLVLPAVIALAGRAQPEAHGGARLGALLAANTLGAVAGALLAPWLLLPTLGVWGALASVAGLYAAGALCVPGPATRGGRVVARLVGIALLVALGTLASPLGQPAVHLRAAESLAWLRTTPAGVVAVVRSQGDLRIQTDNHYSLGGVSERVREARQAHLPLLLHGAARRVAYLGAATGISAGAALEHPIEHLTAVELVPAVAEAARRFFAPWNAGVYDAPRTEVVLDDGRNFLRLSSERFDVVVADLFVPWRAGTGSLYTREHFRAVRSRLAAGGLFCQWLPLYQLAESEVRVVIATFLDVFPDAVLWRGDFQARFPIAALVGFADAAPPAERVDAAVARLRARGIGDRWLGSPPGLWSLYVGPLAPLAPRLRDVPRTLDDAPWIEFETARRHAGPAAPPFTGRAWLSFETALRRASPEPDPVFGRLGEGRRRAAEAGLLLRAADVHFAEGDAPASGAALAAAAERLPPELLAPDRPDSSVLRVWPDAG